MPRINVTREAAPPIKEVTITFTGPEALALISLIGQFGGEYSHLSEIFHDGKRMLVTNDVERTQYRKLVEEAREGIQVRAALER